MDVSNLKAYGPWILVRAERPPRTSPGGIYLPSGNMEERLGQAFGVVLSVGQGKWNKKHTARIHSGLKVGDRVWFRGFLQECNRPSLLDSEHSLINQDDILGVEE
jgi:co-chaperonin GroES (HSP10)